MQFGFALKGFLEIPGHLFHLGKDAIPQGGHFLLQGTRLGCRRKADHLIAEAEFFLHHFHRLNRRPNRAFKRRQTDDPVLQGGIIVGHKVGSCRGKVLTQFFQLVGQQFRLLMGHGKAAQKPGTDFQTQPFRRLLETVKDLELIGVANPFGAQ